MNTVRVVFKLRGFSKAILVVMGSGLGFAAPE
jgi:hypothetical protein